ncbi:tetratricopeptide repeat protein [Croceivirga thetidis]|uniref:Tetratricopeptide repeat protein n=1 Tax=Croceivirga thetidis TaxID=2721623 RepID=A0ABX1GM91_9FLAO|nr:tetratricopeptide repeat protein [Croceivirga thetidis]NKI31021.1 tetratricopeptide repeat protein [Croceivirga thetidis]
MFPKTTLTNFSRNILKYITQLGLVSSLLFTTKGLAQEAPPEFTSSVQRLIELKPTSYQAFYDELKPFRYDTVLMNAFVKRSIETDYPEGQSFALNQLGTKFRNLSQYNRAIELHRRALRLAEQVDNVELKVLSHNLMGVAYRRMDAIKSALDNNQEALRLAESEKEPTRHLKRHINIAYNSIGNLYQTLEQYDLAIEQFKKALQLETDLNNKLGMAINNQNIGDCLEQKGDLKQALDYYRKSLAYNEEINSDYGLLICKTSIAQIYLKQDSPRPALEILESLSDLMAKNGDDFINTWVLSNFGWAHTQTGDFDIAKKYLDSSLTVTRKSQLPNMETLTLRRLSELEARKGNFKDSRDFLQASYEVKEQITNVQNRSYIHDVIEKYESEKKDTEIASLANETELIKLRLRRNQTRILIGILMIALVSTILFVMYRQYKSNNEKKVLSLEQNMLRSQMNPHFLFNSLNSIKLYIINNDQKKAVHYLNKFSKLVRKILEGSSMKEISLEEELETVDLYLNIENIRFSEEINFQIKVDNNIDVERIKIPSLVLQPFLENAIWHGLSSKEGDKNLLVQVSKDDDYHLKISIKDNGVGRAASEIAKEKRVLKRKSVGIDITKERLANFSKDFQNDFDVSIIDLYDHGNKPAGTEVILRIPTI